MRPAASYDCRENGVAVGKRERAARTSATHEEHLP
jgi:hypothetical protein